MNDERSLKFCYRNWI